MIIIENLPEKFSSIWNACQKYFVECRPGDDMHAKEVTENILQYKGDAQIDLDVLIPVAMMHDIGHSAILGEHFDFITGGKKVKNGKLVHMLTGAKIAKTILTEIGYNGEKAKEIIDIITIHDADQIEGTNMAEIFDTENKKFFHDVDVMDRFNADRMEKFKKTFTNEQLKNLLNKELEGFFHPEFRDIAEEKLSHMNFD